ncbi:MAG: DUF4433 domain-containing protein [Fimbriimonadales bacterium]|nr:DUF4433 domain-containing protein [Fimbriimonadales bacterium]
MTHIRNLESILRTGRVDCDARAEQLKPRSIAYTNLKHKRKMRPVPVPPYGRLADYVPFYFAPRSPMLYAIHTGFVASGLSQDEIVYLVTSVETVAQAGKAFVFTDCHPLSNFPRFSNDLRQLNEFVDWSVMRSLTWCNTSQDSNRKSRRQAEFLVHQELEWTLIEQIGVYDAARQASVVQLLQQASYQPVVLIRRDWYY